MPGLFVIAHAPLASALRAVAQHVYPDCSTSLVALDVPPSMAPEHVEAQAAALLATVALPDALILTDVFGATPCNVAQRLADGKHIKVVTGVNVPMLWRSLCYSNEPIDCLVARALSGATQGTLQVSPTRPQTQSRNSPAADEKIDSRDQQ